jgi:hypothetical protein
MPKPHCLLIRPRAIAKAEGMRRFVLGVGHEPSERIQVSGGV